MNPANIKLGLERVRKVWLAMPDIPADTKVVVIGGTNGKGSCVLCLEHLLIESGQRVGAYMSPHLVRFNERIRCDGAEISDQQLCEHLDRVDSARGETELTYFEFTTLAALSFFSSQNLDVIVLEVGLGGRLDAVNILNTDVAILTSVDLDHQDWLGDDLESIGSEKAGIFRSNRWAILGQPSMPASVIEHARSLGVKLLTGGKDFVLVDWGDHRSFNFGTKSWDVPGIAVSNSSLGSAICALHLLQGTLDQSVLNTLEKLQLPARFQQVRVSNRECILDSAHNPAAAAHLSEMLVSQGFDSVDILLGMMADKDIQGFVRALATRANRWLIAEPEISRAATTRKLEEIIRVESSAEIVDLGRISNLKIDQLSQSRPTLVCGSFYTVGEFLTYQVGEASA